MKEIFAFFLLSLLVSLSADAYTCTRRVNPNAVVVFVDTRNSTHEVDAAHRAACARGENFIRYHGNINGSAMTNSFRGLANSGKAITSIVVSGHDGGGSIHGDAGGVDKNDVIKAMKTAYGDKPALMSRLQSVYMWGCWTNGPGEVAVWRTQLPSLRMIAGYIDMAPLNTATASHTVLGGLMEKESQMLAETDQKKLKRVLASVQHINQTYASVYVEACNQNLYYYNKDGSGRDAEQYGGDSLHARIEADTRFTQGNHFVNFDRTFNCQNLPADVEQKVIRINEYYMGRRAIPADTQNGEMRELYKYARNNSMCLKNIPQFNADRLLMMTFWENVKGNFANTFKSEVGAANREFTRMVDKVFHAADSRFAPASLKNMKNYLIKHRQDHFNLTEQNLRGKSRAEIRTMIGFLTTVSNYSSRLHGISFPEVKKLKDRMETYLYQLRPECMDFLSWHEPPDGAARSYNCN